MSVPEVILHPSAIVEVASHATHLLHNDPTVTRVCGILIGTNTDGVIEVLQSLRLKPDDLLNERHKSVEFMTSVYTNRKLIGWYALTQEITENDKVIHAEFAKEDPDSIFLTINGFELSDSTTTKLPLQFNVMRDNEFVPVKHSNASHEMEHIVVNDVFNAGSTEDHDKIEKDGIIYAVRTLKQKAHILINYLKAIQEGKIEKDESILSKIAVIVSSLPVSDNKMFTEEYKQEEEDAKLMVLLMELMRTVGIIGEQTHSYKEITQLYHEKIRREDDKRRGDMRMMNDFAMGGYGMFPGFGPRGGFMEMDDDDD